MSFERSPKSKLVNELSPRKFPRNTYTSPRKITNIPAVVPKTPPQWKKPDDVMKTLRQRIKQNALTTRMKSNDLFKKNENSVLNSSPQIGIKRRNPFRRVSETAETVSKKRKEENENDDKLFQLLGLTNSQESDSLLSLTSQLTDVPDFAQEKYDNSKTFSLLPADWTLRYKMRFISSLPFPWNKTMKTCEEASSITGFVRCIEDEIGGCKKTAISPNAEFHQCCFYWQHPNLPWLPLYPRNHLRKTDVDKSPILTINPIIKESLHRDWSESLRSVFQLVRARHCPFFYLVTSSFNCVFRAAGINCCSETNVLISPTTRGFRKLLSDEAIDFSMPLKAKDKRVSQELGNIDDEGDDIEEEEEGPSEAREWLASLGVGEEEIKKISESESHAEFHKEKTLDGNDESLVYIEGSEVNALFNFLINCRTIIATSGPLAGVPPTVISPVAFYGGTLASLKVRDSTIKVDNEHFFSLEIKGPIMPHAVHNLCNVLKGNIDQFSVSFANIEASKAFTFASKKNIESHQESASNTQTTPGKVFSVENLSDCGLNSRLLSIFCSEVVQQFDSVKFSDGDYICI